MNKKIKVIFFGTPKIGLKSLEYLISSDKIDVLAVVTQPDKPVGRGHKIAMSPIKECALKHNLPVFQPKSIRKELDIQEELKKFEPDFFVTFAFGQILSQEVLDIPKYETINLHASLLPKYRGANPLQRAIIDGEHETGICTMITELALDSGDICIKVPIEITENMNCLELIDIVSEKSPKMIEDTLVDIVEGRLKPEKQCEDDVCIANKLTKEECKIDWKKSAQSIHNLVRGICRCPSAYFTFNDKTIKVIETRVLNGQGNAGEFINVSKEGVEVACGEGSLLLVKVKPENKSEMPSRDWYNGVKNVLKRD